MSLHPVVCSPIITPLVDVLGPVAWQAGRSGPGYPDGAILYWDASQGWQDQTGNQSLTLIGSAYPTITDAGAVNAVDHQWGFDLATGAVRAAFLAGEATVVMQVTMPAMTELTDATDYSLWGDVLFVRRDTAAGSFKLSDGTNTASVAHDWAGGEVVTVVCQCDGDVMRVGVV